MSATSSTIDYKLMEMWFLKIASELMGYSMQDDDQKARTIWLTNQYFERVKQVLLFLERDRGVVNLRALLPQGFFLTRLFDQPHLSVQRSGATYDGKYYILDVIEKNEEISTVSRVAQYSDLRYGFEILEPLSDLIYQQDQATQPSTTTP